MLEAREIAVVWECPCCGSQTAQMTGTSPPPPYCTDGHAPTEMEQRTASRWGCRTEATHQ